MWTETEISDFQVSNNKRLAEVNATLRPDSNLHNKVGVFAPGQSGDQMVCMAALMYREKIFPGKEIVWFSNSPNCDNLKYAPISEIRPWPWANNGLPDGSPDFFPLLCDENNRLNKDLAKNYELTADLEDGYFPCAWMWGPHKRHGYEYSNISKKIFGVPDDWEWHPVLNFSDEERKDVDYFMGDQMPGKQIFIETFAGSGQSLLNEEMIARSMDLCNRHWGECDFIFGSHKFLRSREKFPAYFFQQPGFYSAANFTVRQCALIAEKCDLMISVSSGLTVAASAWGIKQPPTIQFTGSKVCSTQAISNGPFELVTADEKPFEQAKEEFYSRLIELLKKYQ